MAERREDDRATAIAVGELKIQVRSLDMLFRDHAQQDNVWQAAQAISNAKLSDAIHGIEKMLAEWQGGGKATRQIIMAIMAAVTFISSIIAYKFP